MINSSQALYASTKTASCPTPAPSASSIQTLHACSNSKSSPTGQTLHDWYPQRLGVQRATPLAGSRGNAPRRQNQISTPKPTQSCIKHTIFVISVQFHTLSSNCLCLPFPLASCITHSKLFQSVVLFFFFCSSTSSFPADYISYGSYFHNYCQLPYYTASTNPVSNF